MLKRYAKWQFRKWLPFLIIFMAAFTVVFSLSALECAITYSLNGTHPIYPYHPGLPLIMAFAMGILLCFIMPVEVFHYRVSKQSVDVFYQAPCTAAGLKRVRMLLGLAIVGIAVTAGYLTGLLLFVMRYFSTPEVIQAANPDVTYHRLDFNFGVYLAYLPLLLAFVSAQYFINCFLVGMGDYVMDQIFLMLFGNAVLCLVVVAPVLYGAVIAINVPDRYFDSLMYGFGFVGPAILTTSLNYGWSSGSLNHAIGSSILFVTLGAVTGLANFAVPDPSGEVANVRGARNKVIAAVPHAAALLLGTLISCVGTINSVSPIFRFSVLPFMVFLIFGVAYYGILALWRHSWKPSKADLTYYLIVMGVVLTLLVICQIRWSSYSYSA